MKKNKKNNNNTNYSEIIYRQFKKRFPWLKKSDLNINVKNRGDMTEVSCEISKECLHLEKHYRKRLEEMTLGAMLLEDTVMTVFVFNKLSPDMFSDTRNKLVFESIKRLFDGNKPVDVLTVCDDLKKNHNLENAGGVSYIVKLANAVPSAANITEHIDKLAALYNNNDVDDYKKKYEALRNNYNALLHSMKESGKACIELGESMSQNFGKFDKE